MNREKSLRFLSSNAETQKRRACFLREQSVQRVVFGSVSFASSQAGFDDSQDGIITRCSWLRKLADAGASANAYRCIRCKIINLQAARLLILQAEDY